MTDRYGYIGIETLLNYCQNSKDHSITPNDFMRMNRVRIEEPNQGEWIFKNGKYRCTACGDKAIYRYNGTSTIPKEILTDFCPNCGADMRQMIHGCSFASEECKKNPCADCGLKEGE